VCTTQARADVMPSQVKRVVEGAMSMNLIALNAYFIRANG
jgi:hypothetical protein